MKRKVVKLGPSSLVVSLPSNWSKQNKIKAGDHLTLTALNNQLVLTPSVIAEKKSITIALEDETTTAIRVIITNLYRLGYDRMKVTYAQKNTFTTIKKVVDNHLIGFALTEQDEHYCVLENLTEPAQAKLEQIITRQFFIIKEVIDLLTTKGDKKQILHYLDEIKKYDNFSKRVISKNAASLTHATLFYTFLTLLTHSTRYLLLLAESKSKIPESLAMARNMVDDLQKLYLKRQLTYFYRIHRVEKLFRKEFLTSSRTTNQHSLVYQFARSIYLAASPLLDESLFT